LDLLNEIQFVNYHSSFFGKNFPFSKKKKLRLLYLKEKNEAKFGLEGRIVIKVKKIEDE
jgi:hypothetical protein